MARRGGPRQLSMVPGTCARPTAAVSRPPAGGVLSTRMSAEPNDPIASRYASANASLDNVIGSIPPGGWAALSPCEGWTTLGRLVAHARQPTIVPRRRGFDLGAPPDLSSDPLAAWRQHSAAVQGLLDDPEVAGTEYDGFFGRTTIGETVARFYLFDMVVHRWDIATGAGVETEFTEAEMDEIEAAADALGDNIYRPGVCARRDVPKDAGRRPPCWPASAASTRVPRLNGAPHAVLRRSRHGSSGATRPRRSRIHARRADRAARRPRVRPPRPGRTGAAGAGDAGRDRLDTVLRLFVVGLPVRSPRRGRRSPRCPSSEWVAGGVLDRRRRRRVQPDRRSVRSVARRTG